ncbi:glycosyltransferase family 2 protein [Advenella sp. FME57]|uniref:glycosyltransferase family 2 protein n=1 Tax=Advenella sp. FME57 TaxID=2742604 RepID=UPI001865EC5E|nr:glycosyltransferase family 2 protein [Advenella sp. FME57]
MQRVNIIIPTFNRSGLIAGAVDAALGQSYPNKQVTIIDDASTDDTFDVLQPYFDRSDFVYVRLACNMHTAQAKNVGIALSMADAITFHDSDDRPAPDKVLMQARTLFNTIVVADSSMNWTAFEYEPQQTLPVSLVLTEHELIRWDGSRLTAQHALSLVDDFFPNMQGGSGQSGDWILINAGLFRAQLFVRHGGYRNSIEEDRDMRNRLMMAGEVLHLLPQVLLSKFEYDDSLTVAEASNYHSERRQVDRAAIWADIAAWRRTGQVLPQPIDLPDLQIDFISNPDLLGVSEAMMTPATQERLQQQLHAASSR